MADRTQHSPRIARSRAHARRKLRLRPALSVLEDRTLLASFAVTNLQDSGPGSLRDAIVQANASPGLDRIAFDAALFNGGPQTIALTSGFLQVADALNIQGPGADWLTVSGNLTAEVFRLSGESASTISGLTITRGSSTAYGGGIFNSAKLDLIGCTITGNSSTSGGGGISNFGTMTMTDCTVSGNSTTVSGGGVANMFGTLTITRCTVAGNSAQEEAGGILSYASLSITNSTLSGNSALLRGGGISSQYNPRNPGSTLVNCTITGNSASSSGGIFNNGTSVILHNTIVAYSQGGDITGTVSGSHNLIQDAANAGGLRHQVNGNLVGVVPQIAPLGDYGGPTRTVALLSTSPGLNAGTNTVIPPGVTDQRGVARINGGTVDIGAYERGPTNLVVTTLVDEDNGGPSPFVGAGTSLREAIAFANFDPAGGDTITFAPGLTGTIALAGAALPVITATVTVVGPGADLLTIDGQGSAGSGILSIAAGADVAISGLTVARGRANEGGGISNRGKLTLTRSIIKGNAATNYSGGGIRNDVGGVLTLTDCTVSGNSGALGAGIVNYGAMSLTGCTVSGNTSAGAGAGIANFGTSPATLTNCTIADNTDSTSYGVGGGISNLGSVLTLVNCTISGNTTSVGGGIYNSVTFPVTLWNTIVAANHSSGDLTGVFAGGNNLIGDGSGGIAGTIKGAPKLGPLAWNGGPTQTMALLPGSPAVDAGNGTRVPAGIAADQRGVPRIKHGVLDIGAFESGSQTLVVTTLADTVGSGLSLRSAIEYVNYFDPVGNDTILFAPGLTGTITLAGAALPTIMADVTIVGPGARMLTIDAQGAANSRIFSIAPGASVLVSGLTLVNGRGESGGAIFNRGSLTLADSSLSGNVASVSGGAIYNETGATLTLTRTTVWGNASSSVSGGGILNLGTLTLVNSTLVGNVADLGGGLFNARGTVTIANSTVAGNAGMLNGGGILNNGGSVWLTNSIVAGNGPGGDIFGPADGSHNLIGGDPMLSRLAWNGGPTMTVALLPGSPAIDAGDGTLIPAGVATDQRGVARTRGGNVDLGAYESGVNTLVVTTLVDEDNGGIDTTLGSGTSLREAIAFANSDPGGGSTITFAPSLTGTIALVGTALPTIVADMTIVGPGARVLTIDGRGAAGSGILTIAVGAHVTLTGLTLSRGISPKGGAILNHGTLDLTECTISDNMASLSGGGGIYNQTGATLTLTRSTVSGNNGGYGGGIGNNGTVELVNSTVSGNIGNFGGGLFNASGTVTIASSTVADNIANINGGGIFSTPDSSLTLTNSIVALNGSAEDLYGSASGGNNLIGDGSGGIPGTITGDPLLGPLAWNGGPTQTMALLPGSPAIGVGVGLGVTTDQRGFPLDALPDIGAFQYQGAPPTATISGPATGIVQVLGTYTLTASDHTPDDQDVEFTYNVDWNGDGTDVQSFTGPASLQVTHAYAVADSYTPVVTVIDQHQRSSGPATQASPVVVAALTTTSLAQAISTIQNVSLEVTSHVQAQAALDAVNGIPLTTWQQANPINLLVKAGVISDQVVRPSSPDARINVSSPGAPRFSALGIGAALDVTNPYGGESQQLAATISVVIAAVAVGSVIGANVGAGYIPSGVPLPAWSPGLVVEQGTVTWSDTLFVTATDSPLIIVKGGTLILKHSMILGSPHGTRPVIEVSGGTLILAAPEPGGSNVLGTFGLQPLIRVTGTGKVIDEGGTTYLQFSSDGTSAQLAGTTVTQLTSSAPSASIGQTVTYTASVTGAPAGEGSVQFIDATTNTLLGTIPLGSDGKAALSFTVSTAIAGHTIVATYLPTDGSLHPSSDRLTQTVLAATTTTVTGPSSATAFGQSVTFTATVTNTSTEGGVPTGTVKFFVGSTFLGTGSPLSGSGSAATSTFTTANLPVGAHSIRAVYTPDGDFQGGEGAGQVAINPADTTTILSSSASAAIPGQSVTFTAIVAAVLPGGGTPTGSVTFKNGSTLLGTVPLVVVGNQVLASLTTVFSTAGSLAIKASYASSDGNHTASSATLDQLVLGSGVFVSGTTLYLVGANTSDTVRVSRTGQGANIGLSVDATLNGVRTTRTFTQALTAIVFHGYQGNDKLTVGPAINLPTTVVTGNGNDTIQLGDGNHSVNLGNGNNTVQLGNGSSTVTLGSGNDTVRAGDGDHNINGGDGNNTVQLGNGSSTVNTGNGNDTVQAGNGNNTINGGNGNNTIQLGNGANTVTTGNGNDTVRAGDGSHTINGGNGNNTVQLGDGSSTVTLGNGNDTVRAGDGNHTVDGGDGNNTVQLGNGANTVTTGNGNDTIQVGNGNNTVNGGNGNNTVQAGDGNNTITTGNGNDTIRLGHGENVVDSGNGNDTVQAGNGSNLVVGGLGNRTIKLGNGNNILIDGSVTLTQPGDSLRQVLHDWNTNAATAVNQRIRVTYNASHPSSLQAGKGRNWFFYSYAKTTSNKKSTDFLN